MNQMSVFAINKEARQDAQNITISKNKRININRRDMEDS